jgi:hypothetical protein
MTIAAGFVARDGILLCTDSQYTGQDKTYRPKIVSPHCDLNRKVTFAFCGDEDYAKSATEDAVQAINKLPEGTPIGEIRNSIRRAIKAMTKDYKSQPYADHNQTPQFLIAIHDRPGHSILFSAREAAMASVSSYACIGSGAYIGNYIAAILEPSEFLPIRILIPMAIQMIAAAKKHDAYCGGGSHFVALRGAEFRGYFFGQPDSSDAIFGKYEQLSGEVLKAMSNGNLSEEEFGERVAIFTSALIKLRKSMHEPTSTYNALVRHLSPEDEPNPESTKPENSSQLPSPE